MDMGGHCIDLLEMFFGPVAKICCFMNRSVQDYASEDSAAVLLSFENGATGTVDTFFCIPDESSKNALELYGSKGSIIARGTIGQGASGDMVAHLAESGGYDAQQSRIEDGGIRIAAEPVNTYQAEIEAFGQAILDGTEPPVSGEDGLHSQRVLSACYESARTGRVI